MTCPLHWVAAHKLVTLQAAIHINYVMDLNRLLKTHGILLWFDFLDSKVLKANMGPNKVLSASDGPNAGPMNLAIRVVLSTNPMLVWWYAIMQTYIIYRFHDGVYDMYSLWLDSKLIIVV